MLIFALAFIIGNRPVETETMTTSWYGQELQGRQMANGEIFDPGQPVVAHRDLPFDTKLILFNPETKRLAIGVVKDRGPFVKGRKLDVSESLARQLGFHRDGVKNLQVMIAR